MKSAAIVNKDMRRKKATGNDNIPVDLLQELSVNNDCTLNKIYMIGKWPKEFEHVAIIEVPKKIQAKK